MYSFAGHPVICCALCSVAFGDFYFVVFCRLLCLFCCAVCFFLFAVYFVLGLEICVVLFFVFVSTLCCVLLGFVFVLYCVVFF